MPTPAATRVPAIYLGHGAPPLVDDQLWSAELAAWAAQLPRPRGILVLSAHWESAPLAIGATDPGVGLVYDFGGFPERYYRARYDPPGAGDLAAAVRGLMPDTQPVIDRPRRGLDHGAYVPLMVMYPKADIPVLQLSMPTLDPVRLMDLGRRLRPLRDEGVLLLASGFMTHGLPYLREFRADAPPPSWSVEFDAWAAQALAGGQIDELVDFRNRAPGMPYAHPTVDHFAPLFVALGAADEPSGPVDQKIDGYWFGLSKRSFQVS